MVLSNKIGISEESIEALKRALIGVKDKREEAFILLNAVPEDWLTEIVRLFRQLTGLEDQTPLFNRN